jgi:SEC-C motif
MSKAPRKVGRNDPCPCGSGKKYKKCHGMNGKGQVNSQATHQAKPGSIPVNATSIQMAPMGLPGQHQDLVVVNQSVTQATRETTVAHRECRGSTQSHSFSRDPVLTFCQKDSTPLQTDSEAILIWG